jgi:hypothetical protein
LGSAPSVFKDVAGDLLKLQSPLLIYFIASILSLSVPRVKYENGFNSLSNLTSHLVPASALGLAPRS